MLTGLCGTHIPTNSSDHAAWVVTVAECLLLPIVAIFGVGIAGQLLAGRLLLEAFGKYDCRGCRTTGCRCDADEGIEYGDRYTFLGDSAAVKKAVGRFHPHD